MSDILEFDSTACIVAMLDEDKAEEIPDLYTMGSRSVIKLKKDQDPHTILEQMVDVCNELKNDECVACWKFNRFANKF